ncbi:putative F-box protein [Cardamine amara subsp. amara]|uniref:F-box protein n=1 Tax=Cardamine amara subsp. amara TaxID=228776 RepID=A0ABD1B1N0_CARAN
MENALIAYEGSLALVHSIDGMNSGIKLWVLENAEKHDWSEKSFLAPFSHTDPSLKGRFKLSGVTDNGEFSYVQSTFLRSFYIKYFDPKRNIFRMVKFKGIADREFRRTNGLGNRLLDGLQTFPSHVENLSLL